MGDTVEAAAQELALSPAEAPILGHNRQRAA